MYYLDLRILYTVRDLSIGVGYTEVLDKDATALTGKMQLIRSNAMTRCDAADVLELLQTARMSLHAADFPFIGPTQFWLREDILAKMRNEVALSAGGTFSIQVRTPLSAGANDRRAITLPRFRVTSVTEGVRTAVSISRRQRPRVSAQSVRAGSTLGVCRAPPALWTPFARAKQDSRCRLGSPGTARSTTTLSKSTRVRSDRW